MLSIVFRAAGPWRIAPRPTEGRALADLLGPRPDPSDDRSWAVISTGRKLACTFAGVEFLAPLTLLTLRGSASTGTSGGLEELDLRPAPTPPT